MQPPGDTTGTVEVMNVTPSPDRYRVRRSWFRRLADGSPQREADALQLKRELDAWLAFLPGRWVLKALTALTVAGIATHWPW